MLVPVSYRTSKPNRYTRVNGAKFLSIKDRAGAKITQEPREKREALERRHGAIRLHKPKLEVIWDGVKNK